MFSVSGYSLKCACAFTHLQGGQGQRWTLGIASRYLSPLGEIYGSFLVLKEGRLGIAMSTWIQRLVCTWAIFWPNSFIFKKTSHLREWLPFLPHISLFGYWEDPMPYPNEVWLPGLFCGYVILPLTSSWRRKILSYEHTNFQNIPYKCFCAYPPHPFLEQISTEDGKRICL